MRITSKGQVTIPQAIREQAGLDPSCEVQFRLVGDQVVLEKVEDEGQQRAREAMVRLRAHHPRSGLSTDAILARCLAAGPVAINPVSSGEVAFAYERIEVVDEALSRHIYTYRPIPREAAFLAAYPR